MFTLLEIFCCTMMTSSVNQSAKGKKSDQKEKKNLKQID